MKSSGSRHKPKQYDSWKKCSAVFFFFVAILFVTFLIGGHHENARNHVFSLFLQMDDVAKQLINLSICWLSVGKMAFGKLLRLLRVHKKPIQKNENTRNAWKYHKASFVFTCCLAAFLTLLGAKRGYSLWRFSG